MELGKKITLSEVSQTQKDKYGMYFCLHEDVSCEGSDNWAKIHKTTEVSIDLGTEGKQRDRSP